MDASELFDCMQSTISDLMPDSRVKSISAASPMFQTIDLKGVCLWKNEYVVLRGLDDSRSPVAVIVLPVNTPVYLVARYANPEQQALQIGFHTIDQSTNSDTTVT